MDKIVQYYIVNKDLKMSAGKIAAQVGHTAILTVLKQQNTDIFSRWLQTGQTKIVLGAKEKDLRKLVNEGHIHIIDSGLTEIPSGSLTVVALPVSFKSEYHSVVKRFRLL